MKVDKAPPFPQIAAARTYTLHVIGCETAGRSDRLRFPAAALAIVAADLEVVRTQRLGVRVNPILPGAVDASLYREMNAGRNRWRS